MRIKIISAPNQKAFGGDLQSHGATWDNGYSYIGNGGSHEANPNEGVQIGVDPQGVPNLVEEGEVLWNDFVFSRRINMPDKDRKLFKLGGNKPLSYAEAALRLSKEAEERPNDPLSQASLDKMLTSLSESQETLKAKREQARARRQFNQMSPEEQMNIMQMAQQQQMAPQGPQNPSMGMMENPYGNMSADGGILSLFQSMTNKTSTGLINSGNSQDGGIPTNNSAAVSAGSTANINARGGRVNKYAKGSGLKSYKSKADIEKNLPWLRSMYVGDDNNTSAWDALFDSNGNIIATKGGNTGLYDPNGAYMQALGNLSADKWSQWSDAQKQQFVTNLKTINPSVYSNYTIDNVGKGDWSWDRLNSLATDGYVGGHHQAALFANEAAKTEGASVPAGTPDMTYRRRVWGPDGNLVRTEDVSAEDIKLDANGLDYLARNKGTTKGNLDTEKNIQYYDYREPRAEVPDENTMINMPYDRQRTWMRYAPAVGAGIGVLTDAFGITNKPDYSSADAVLDAATRAGKFPEVSYQSIGNYLRYNPMDINYEHNKLNQEAAATRRAIQNTAGTRGAAMAGILASDYNAQSASGDLFRKALEYNDALQQKVEDFNRGTNIFNSQQDLAVQRANQAAHMQANQMRLSGTTQAESLRQSERQQAAAARSANLTNFLQSLGDIGNENEQRNWMKSLYATGYFGNSPVMARSLYGDRGVYDNYMKNNPNATVDEIAEATRLDKKTIESYQRKDAKAAEKAAAKKTSKKEKTPKVKKVKTKRLMTDPYNYYDNVGDFGIPDNMV